MENLLGLLAACNAADGDGDDTHTRKIQGVLPPYPGGSLDDDDAKSVWYTWDSDLRTWASVNRMQALLVGPTYGQPLPPPDVTMPVKVEHPGDPPAHPVMINTDGMQADAQAVADATNTAFQEAYDEALATHTTLVTAYDEYVTARDAEIAKVRDFQLAEKVEVHAYKQYNLRSYLRRAVRNHPDMNMETLQVDSTHPQSGSLTYQVMKDAAVRLMDMDAIDTEQQRVLLKITPMHDDDEVHTFIRGYKTYYNERWCKLFTATSDDEQPWTKRVPESLIVSTIKINLPALPSWQTFVAINAQKLRDGVTLAEYLSMMQRQANDNRSSLSQTMHANPAMSSDPTLVGPSFDCLECKKHNVPSGRARQHKPSWPGCPHHDAWKSGKDKKKNRRTKRRGGNGSTKKKRPSAEHPCSKCGAPDHWARDCKAEEGKDSTAAVIPVNMTNAINAAVQASLGDFMSQWMQPQQQQLAPVHPMVAQWNRQRAAPGGNVPALPMPTQQNFQPAPQPRFDQYGRRI